MRIGKACGIGYLCVCVILGGSGAVRAEEVRTAVVRSNTAFALDMYHQLSSGAAGLAFSPYSISTALAMTYAGARENTELEMTRALHITTGRDRFHKASGELSERLAEQARAGGYEFLIANALWFQMGYGLQEDFLRIQEQAYGMRPKEVDFASNPEAQRVGINRWVSEQTRSRIQDLIAVGMITGMTRVVLVNALYFKGQWDSKFDAQDTQEGDFTTASGEKTVASLMHQTADFAYMEDEDVQVLELPYRAQKFSLLCILPRTNSLAEVEKGFSAARLDQYISGLESTEVSVILPRFKVETAFVLNDTLNALGIEDAFDSGRADFSGMNGRKDLFISYVVHKAFVEVDESGSEAAAATAVIMTLKAMPGEMARPKVFRADHPFIFLIRDKATGSIIFMGRVDNPGQV